MSMEAPYAICGGSFNPVHNGHLNMGRVAVERFAYRSILYIPVARPPHKSAREMVPSEHRLAMLRLAIAPYDWARLDERELRRGGPSYTVDTLRELITENGSGQRPGLLLGDDLADDFDQWREAEQIVKLCDIILYRRGGTGGKNLTFPCRQVDDFAYAVSSSELRQAIASQSDSAVISMAPKSVLRYINREGLYRRDRRGDRQSC